jgi:hypothetical protein
LSTRVSAPAEYNAFENDRLRDGEAEAIRGAQHEFSRRVIEAGQNGKESACFAYLAED